MTRTEDLTIAALSAAAKLEQARLVPNLLTSQWNNESEVLKEHHFYSIERTMEKAMQLVKPCISVLGAYSSGKSFIINYLLKSEVLKSAIDPTTACLTVIRHVSDRPKDWPEKPVIVLKQNSDLRTVSVAAVQSSGEITDLKRLTSYPAGEAHDAVIVFLESDILKNFSLIDVPGIGTAEEIDAQAYSANANSFRDAESFLKDAAFEKTNEHEKFSREIHLNRLAINQSDAYLILSAVVGNEGAFASGTVNKLLRHIADSAGRFGDDSEHRNILFVGTNADPSRKDLSDTDATIYNLATNLHKNINKLNPIYRSKFNLQGINKRITLFYALDPEQIRFQVQMIAKLLLKNMATLSSEEALRLAEKQYEPDHRVQRVQSFDAAISGIDTFLQIGMRKHRALLASEWLTATINNFSAKADEFRRDAQSLQTFEALSKWYKSDEQNRESSWKEIVSSFSRENSAAKDATRRRFEEMLAWWSDSDNVYGYLKKTFGENEELAKSDAAEEIQKSLDTAAAEFIRQQSVEVERNLNARLVGFDKRHLSGPDQGALSGTSDTRSSVEFDPAALRINIETASAANTFKSLAAGVGGGIVVAAYGGSTLATLAFAKILGVTIGIASGVGLGGAALGVLGAIPIGGWLVAGIAGLAYGLYKWFAWRKAMSSAIAKSILKGKLDASGKFNDRLNELFGEIDAMGRELLSNTKKIIDAKIEDAHLKGSGHIKSADLKGAAEYYSDIVAIAFDAQKKIKLESPNGSKEERSCRVPPVHKPA